MPGDLTEQVREALGCAPQNDIPARVARALTGLLIMIDAQRRLIGHLQRGEAAPVSLFHELEAYATPTAELAALAAMREG